MSRFPRLTGAEIIAALAKAGFVDSRVKGSHHRLRHSDGRVTTVPSTVPKLSARDCSRKFCATAIYPARNSKNCFEAGLLSRR